jgi:hypothetical protein
LPLLDPVPVYAAVNAAIEVENLDKTYGARRA